MSRIQNADKIIENHISGFHQYALEEPVHISYAVRNLCELLGVGENELLSETEDLYVRFVHPSDREEYAEFIGELSQGKGTRTLQYRLVKRDGSILCVSDTVSIGREKDGSLVGYSVLTDITKLKGENQNLQFLNETIPCGFIKYTCEKQPKITYVNERMLEMLRVPESKDGEIDYLELYKNNIYLSIPAEERRRFGLYLKLVQMRGTPVAGEMTLLRWDGTRGRYFGWVTKSVNEEGVEEFQSVCMDVSDRYFRKKEMELNRYIKALTDVYDMIFEYDLSSDMVRCRYGQKSNRFRLLENIPMQMKDATEKWMNSNVYEEDREKFYGFFCDFWNKKYEHWTATPPQLQYRVVSADGEVRKYTGIFLKVDDAVSLFCCRNMPDKEENQSLKNMQEMVQNFTDGIAAFEIVGEQVTPLYASTNLCHFFGYTKEEWLPMMKNKTPIKEFISRCGTTLEAFMELLRRGEAEFTYFDWETKTERCIKAVCSQKSPDKASPSYIMMYHIDDRKQTDKEIDLDREPVSIRTFGYFDVFVGGKAIAFRSQKAKELLALLADRRGGFISSDEAISYLWPEEPSNTVTLARYRKVALRLKNILEEYGISDIVEAVDGKRRLVTDRVQCDLYDYLTGKEEFKPLFKGSYLLNYSWGETTLGELTGENMY